MLLADGGTGWQQWTNLAVVARTAASGSCRPSDGTSQSASAQKRNCATIRLPSASYKRIHDLAGRLIAGQETERHRIARELHDDLSQKLALLTIDIEQLARGALLRAAELAKRVGEISRRAAEIATDVHRLSHELHPTRARSSGSGCCDPNHLPRCRPPARHRRRFPSYPRANGHSTAGGALLLPNRAGRITQRGQAQRRQAGVRAADWRRRSARPAPSPIPGWGSFRPTTRRLDSGLVSMRERVNFLGGRIAIHSAPGRGTPHRRSRSNGAMPGSHCPNRILGQVSTGNAARAGGLRRLAPGSIRTAARRWD